MKTAGTNKSSLHTGPIRRSTLAYVYRPTTVAMRLTVCWCVHFFSFLCASAITYTLTLGLLTPSLWVRCVKHETPTVMRVKHVKMPLYFFYFILYLLCILSLCSQKYKKKHCSHNLPAFQLDR